MRYGLWALLSMVFLAACQADSEPPPQGSTPGWTWMSGSATKYQAGAYGIKGVAAPSNVPGARLGAASWTDSGGKLWLFGSGDGLDGAGRFSVLNDLWMYDPVSGEWTWVSGSNLGYDPGHYGTRGVAAPANIPGARGGGMTWTDSDGKLWLFGGGGYVSDGESGELNDLWKFDPTTSLWTWVSGSNGLFQPGVYGTKGVAAPENVPGARSSAAFCIDPQGKFWLFGGYGYIAEFELSVNLNDLWCFDPATLEWTWVSGSDSGDGLGVYGTRGQADPSNVPGSRGESELWVDSQGELWLFGGWGWGPRFEDNTVFLNDLWRFDPATLEWTWIHGGDAGAQPGVYGTKGLAAPSNTPGSRHSALSWRDPQGKFWLFGGGGVNAAGQDSDLNDLWRFDPMTLEWTWVSGSDNGGQTGVYGIKGKPAPANAPGAHNTAATWVGPQGTLWLFGGAGPDSTGDWGLLNDLWRYVR